MKSTTSLTPSSTETSKSAWERLLKPLNSEELLLVHGDWGLSFHGAPTKEELLKSLLSSTSENQQVDQQRLSFVALRASPRLSSKQSWHAFSFSKAVPMETFVISNIQNRLKESLSDFIPPENFHISMIPDTSRENVLWIRVASRIGGGEDEEKWNAVILCIKVNSFIVCVAGQPNPEHAKAILDCVSSSIGCPGGVKDTNSVGSSIDNLLSFIPISTHTQKKDDKETQNPQEPENDTNSRPSATSGNGRRNCCWWKQKIQRKVRMINVKCIDGKNKVKVIVRGTNIHDGLLKLGELGLLNDTSPSSRYSMSTKSL